MVHRILSSYIDWKTWKNESTFSSQGNIGEFWTYWKHQGIYPKYWKSEGILLKMLEKWVLASFLFLVFHWCFNWSVKIDFCLLNLLNKTLKRLEKSGKFVSQKMWEGWSLKANNLKAGVSVKQDTRNITSYSVWDCN